MKIKSTRIWKADLGTTRPYTIAFKTVEEVWNTFLEVELENGITALGSANPSEYVVGVNVNHTLDALVNDGLDWLVGRDIRELKKLTDESKVHFSSQPGAQAAVDIALHDALAQHMDVPLVKLLGQYHTELPTSITIGIKNVEETIKEAQEYYEMGFYILKVKLGLDLEEDIERILKLRERFGRNILIRIDANQGYSVAQTLDFFHRTKTLDIELIEQPLPASQVDELRALPSEIRKKIAADESLVNVQDALRLLFPDPAAQIFNIKLMKCGGISTALEIAKLASYRQIDLFWGCNDESGVSISAALHTAFACPNTRYLDLDGSLDLAHDLVEGGFTIVEGVMRLTNKSGLGVVKH